MKNCISLILCLSLFLGISTPLTAYADGESEYSLANENIEVYVSAENGGFAIKTAEGDKLKKSDNNKDLLYHNGEYDTSFTSFEVERDGEKKEYIFGGDYGFLGLGSSDVEVTQLADSIEAVWSVDGISFTQTIEIPNTASNQHGMVAISYKAEVTSGSPAKIKSRILFDTSLGNQDYAYYNVNDSLGYAVTYESEMELLGSDYSSGYIPESIYASDNDGLSGIAAYSINTTAYKAVFAHWNNLASSVFEYAPDPAMTFTNANNIEYQTADSAYALYNDWGEIGVNADGSVSCYYGVYSNYNVDVSECVALNVIAPNSLELSADRESYLPANGAVGNATFPVNINMTNFSTNDLPKIAIAAYTSNGITPLDMNGNELDFEPNSMNPYYVTYEGFQSGGVLDYIFQFKASVGDSATYRKVELRVYDISDGTMTFSNANMIGSKSFNILCPGGDGSLPQVTFTGADPELLYNKGGNRYIITGTNFSMLTDPAHYSIVLASDDGLNSYTVDPNDIVIDAELGTMTLILPEEYVPGTYHVYINWRQSAYDNGIIDPSTPSSYTSEALRLIFSEDPKYKNNVYGVVAVVQDKSPAPNQVYTILSFKDEAAFNTYKQTDQTYSEILLEVRGEFEAVTDGHGNMIHLTGTSQSGSNNVYTINQCLDFQDGIIEIYYENDDINATDRKINVDFDGKLYTSGERTHIASVPAALTSIENGQEYGLLEYNLHGERKNETNVNYISLVWGHTGLDIAQQIAGSIFQLGFGILGVINDDNGNAVGKTVSFTASFDIGFLIPNGQKYKDNMKYDDVFDRILTAFDFNDYYHPRDLRERANVLFGKNNDLTNEDRYIQSQQAATMNILVRDVLFAFVPAQNEDEEDLCGFYGFRAGADIMLPSYTEAMPQIKARLEVNTIRNYSFTVEGGLKFANLDFGASLEVLSVENEIPVPNKLFVYCNLPAGALGFFLDPAGAVVITGGGGGFDNLYETIMVRDKLPTLQLMLRLYIKVIQVLSCQADGMFSLQGVSLSMSNLQLDSVPNSPPVIPYAGLKLQWLPTWYFHVAMNVDLFQILTGGGYIVVDQKDNDDVFFEAFAKVMVRIPDYVGLIGGIDIAGASVGISTDKVWGSVEVIGVGLGIVYYWGNEDSFDFGVGVGSAEPTYPELLPSLQGIEPVLLGYDEKAGKNVYMKIGTNIRPGAQAEIVSDLDATPVLLGESSVQSLDTRTQHRVTIGGNSDEIITLVYPAQSLEHAQELYAKMDGLPADTKLYPDAEANANLTFNEGTATLAVTTKEGTNATYNITTPVATDITILSVAPIPEVSAITAASSNGKINVSYSGANLNELDKISFYLAQEQTVTENNTDSDMLLGVYTDPVDVSSGSASFDIPKGLQSGGYYVRAVYSQENVVSNSIATDNKISYVNPDQPQDADVVACENAGDYCLAAVLGDIPENISGYIVNVYNENGSLTDFAGVEIPRASIVDNKLIVGGRFNMPVYDGEGNIVEGETAEVGLEPGKRYKVGVSPYYEATEGAGLYRVIGKEVAGNIVTLNTPTQANISVSSDKGGTLFADGNVTFTVSSNEKLTGVWSIANGYEEGREGYYGEFADAETITIPLANLPDNDYVLEIWGSDETNDSFSHNHKFTVDTTEPRLIVSAPINGSLFGEDGKLTVTGITDLDTYITVEIDGVVTANHVPFSELNADMDENGCFSFDLMIDQSISTHDIKITSTDAAGNASEHEAKVNHAGLSKVNHVDVYYNGVLYSNKNISTLGDMNEGRLSLVAETPTGSFAINDDIVRWSINPVTGNATVDETGKITLDQQSEGYIVGQFNVTSVAPMTASVTFGTLENTSGNVVVVGSTVGGTATGGGEYAPGDTVTLTAQAESGYQFSHWELDGVTVEDASSATIEFIMPDAIVHATAHFKTRNSGSLNGGTGSGRPVIITTDVIASIDADEGACVEYELTQSVENENSVVAQYSTDGGNTYITVAKSAVIDGVFKFIAPVSAQYRIVTADGAGFYDVTESNWAYDYVDFVSIREITAGMGDNMFEPDGNLTRAMFVTMLGRMHGNLGTYGQHNFTDVAPGSWYEEYVSWATHNGIVEGYDAEHFAPDDRITREQICAMIDRYMKYEGYTAAAETGSKFIDDTQISGWAYNSVEAVKSLEIVVGYEDGSFRPQELATRAEAAVMFTKLIYALLANR